MASSGFPSAQLIHFQCPQQPADGTCCPQQATATRCAFGHRTASSSQQLLKLIPPNFCLDHLRGMCRRVESTFQMNGQELIWCSAGFHPRNMADCERITREIAEKKIRVNDFSCCGKTTSGGGKLLSIVKTKSSAHQLENRKGETQVRHQTGQHNGTEQVRPKSSCDPNRDKHASCRLCSKLIGLEVHQPFGLLEHCSHSFCYNCLIEHQNRQRNAKCPVCRVPSVRILIWPFWLASGDIKTELLDAQETCLAPSRSADHLVNSQTDKWIILLLVVVCVILIGFNVTSAY